MYEINKKRGGKKRKNQTTFAKMMGRRTGGRAVERESQVSGLAAKALKEEHPRKNHLCSILEASRWFNFALATWYAGAQSTLVIDANLMDKEVLIQSQQIKANETHYSPSNTNRPIKNYTRDTWSRIHSSADSKLFCCVSTIVCHLGRRRQTILRTCLLIRLFKQQHKEINFFPLLLLCVWGAGERGGWLFLIEIFYWICRSVKTSPLGWKSDYWYLFLFALCLVQSFIVGSGAGREWMDTRWRSQLSQD